MGRNVIFRSPGNYEDLRTFHKEMLLGTPNRDMPRGGELTKSLDDLLPTHERQTRPINSKGAQTLKTRDISYKGALKVSKAQT